MIILSLILYSSSSLFYNNEVACKNNFNIESIWRDTCYFINYNEYSKSDISKIIRVENKITYNNLSSLLKK